MVSVPTHVPSLSACIVFVFGTVFNSVLGPQIVVILFALTYVPLEVRDWVGVKVD